MDLCVCWPVFSLVVGDSGWSCRANLVSYLVFNCRSFLFVVLGFHLVGGFFQSSFGFFMDFLYMGNEGGGRGHPKRCLRFGAWEDVGVIAIVNLEGAFTSGGVYVVIVSKGREG